MRLIDADALKEKKVYSRERHEKIVPVAEIDWSPTIPAIPVEWLRGLMNILVTGDALEQGQALFLSNVIETWQEEQEAQK